MKCSFAFFLPCLYIKSDSRDSSQKPTGDFLFSQKDGKNNNRQKDPISYHIAHVVSKWQAKVLTELHGEDQEAGEQEIEEKCIGTVPSLESRLVRQEDTGKV